MTDLTKIADPYERKARIYPGLICLFPVVLTVFILYPTVFNLWSSLAAIVISFGLLQLIAHLARDRGKQLEDNLFQEWGGMPSVSFLRFRDNRVTKPIKQRYHLILSQRTEIDSPTEELEASNPNEADEIYRSWSDYLRGQTRDTKKYPLLFKENVNYGFRRNLLGIKTFCLISGIMCFAINTFKFYHYIQERSSVQTSMLSITIVILIYVLIFLFVVKGQWVKVTADAYARQLLESLNT